LPTAQARVGLHSNFYKIKYSSSQNDELYLSINICSDALADNGSGDSSEDGDGNKGDSNAEVGDNSVERTDDNNQLHNVVEIELAIVLVPDSYVLSPSFMN
jgi:hypothetical protein